MFIKKILNKLRGEIDINKLKKRGLKVGTNFKLMSGCIIDSSHCWHIEIGDDVILAPRVHILVHDASTKIHLGYTKIANVKIGSRVFIGAGSIVLPGVTIGDDVIIGAGSVVTKNIPSNSLALGNPSVIVSYLDDYMKKQKALMNDENCFDETYVFPHITEDKKEQMKRLTEKHKQSFVI